MRSDPIPLDIGALSTHRIGMKWIPHALLPALCIAAMPLFADTVLLTNGNELEGIINSETDDVVVLDLGVGSMKIRKTRIKNIVRSNAEETRGIQQAWKKKHILHSRHVPTGLEQLAKDFRALEAARASATKAAAAASALRSTLATTRSEIEELHKEHVRVNDTLQWLDPKADPSKYNATVAKNNTISSSLNLKYAELDRAHKQIAESEKAMGGYLNTLAAFQDSFKRAAADEDLLSMGAGHKTFFDEMQKRLAPYTKEYKSHHVITATRGRSTLVAVIINKRQPATLILDTGASAVTISKALAEKLNLDLERAAETTVTLADGKSVSAHEVLLSSVAAGTAAAAGVEALVLPDPPAEGIDGLLGMSFLGRFHMKLDGGGGTLKLEELDLRQQ